MEAQKNRKKLRLAIATTVADAKNDIAEFIEYHSKIGFEKIYVFVDDNDSETVKVLERYKNVTYKLKNNSLFEQWELLSDYKASPKWALINEEVMIRQELNFLIAYQNAKQDGMDWLLHIDLDELFYPNGHDIHDYFSHLQFNAINAVTLLNYEAIYTQLDAKSIYRSSNIFKVNFFRFKHWIFNQEQRKLIKENSWIGEKYFKYYQNGKSCIYLHGKSVHIADVHSIWTQGRRKFGKKEDPIILHFPCASFNIFLKKYQRLGKFSDTWMGIKRTGHFIDETHLLARDIVNTGNKDEMEAFYHQNFLLSDAKIHALLTHDMAIEIDYHIDTLQSLNV